MPRLTTRLRFGDYTKHSVRGIFLDRDNPSVILNPNLQLAAQIFQDVLHRFHIVNVVPCTVGSMCVQGGQPLRKLDVEAGLLGVHDVRQHATGPDASDVGGVDLSDTNTSEDVSADGQDDDVEIGVDATPVSCPDSPIDPPPRLGRWSLSLFHFNPGLRECFHFHATKIYPYTKLLHGNIFIFVDYSIYFFIFIVHI